MSAYPDPIAGRGGKGKEGEEEMGKEVRRKEEKGSIKGICLRQLKGYRRPCYFSYIYTVSIFLGGLAKAVVTLPPPTAYSSQDARGACDARSSSAAHGSAITVGTVAPKTPAMGWARPTTCAYRSLSTQCPGPAKQAGVALDTAHPIGLQCCQHPYRQSRTPNCRQDSI